MTSNFEGEGIMPGTRAGLALLPAVVAFGLVLSACAEEKKAEKKEDKNEEGWVQLFNGKDLTGWKTHPNNPGHWEVKDGVIVGRGWEVSPPFPEGGAFE